MDTTTNVEILTGICRKKGLVFNDAFQVVDGLAVYPREVFCPVDYDTMKLKKTRKTVTIHWFSGSWQTQEDLRILEEERRWKRREQRSNLRVAIGSRLFGASGYEKLKKLLRRK